MRVGRRVEVQAEGERRQLTLGEVRAFVAEMDQAGAADSTVVCGRLNWRGQSLRSLWATAVRFGDPEPSK